MNIACCGIDREQFRAAEQACGCPVLYFADAPDRRGDVRLAYALRDGVPSFPQKHDDSAYTSIPWDRPIPSHPIKLHRSSSACCGSSQNTIKEA